jgi:hypothetical protein
LNHSLIRKELSWGIHRTTELAPVALCALADCMLNATQATRTDPRGYRYHELHQDEREAPAIADASVALALLHANTIESKYRAPAASRPDRPLRHRPNLLVLQRQVRVDDQIASLLHRFEVSRR